MIKIPKSFKIFTENLGDALIPKKFRRQIQDYLAKASIYSVPYINFGVFIYAAIVMSLVLDIILMTSKMFSGVGVIGGIVCSIIIIPLLFLLIIFLTIRAFKLYLDVKIQVKTNQMKECFPEFLSNLALNLRIGGTLDNALENSADKEFGALADEIKIVVRNIRLGTTEEVAIREFMDKYNIDVINDTFELILISWKKGGNTANLTERIYENMKESRFLRDKIVASVTNYRIFLTVLAIGIAPAMFALTFHLIDLIRRISKIVSNIPENTSLPLTLNAVKINDPQFVLFSTLCVLLIAVSIAFIISIVKTGEAKHAYKQIIIYAVLSYLSFQVFMFLFQIFFSRFAI